MFSKDNAKSISERYSQFPRMYNLPEIRIEVDKAQEIIDEIKQKMISGGRSFCDLDGIRFIDDSGWWLLRSSNTQPAIIARCEACSKDTRITSYNVCYTKLLRVKAELVTLSLEEEE